jgi:hypothetical protein
VEVAEEEVEVVGSLLEKCRKQGSYKKDRRIGEKVTGEPDEEP